MMQVSSAGPDGGYTRARAWSARLLLLAIGALIVLLLRRATLGDAVADVASGYAFCAALLIAAWHFCQQSGVRLRDLIGRPPADRREWGWVALAMPLLVFGLAALISVNYALSWVAPGFVVGVLLAPDEPSLSTGQPVLVMLETGAAVLFGPILEELFFRGGLQLRWSERWGNRWGFVASAALFAAFHADPIGAFVFAACATLMYRRTGTLLVPMACHVLHNALAMLASVVDADDGSMTLAELRDAGPWSVLATILLGAGLLLAMQRLHGHGLAPLLSQARLTAARRA